MRVSGEEMQAGREGVETRLRGKESALFEQKLQLLSHAQVSSGESEWSRHMDTEGIGTWYWEPESFFKKGCQIKIIITELKCGRCATYIQG